MNTQQKSTKTGAAKPQTPRKYWTAISITAGIIQVINGDTGAIVVYRQRGIQQISQSDRAYLINLGLLDRNWQRYQELPRNITISYEDEDILGRASATFPIKQIAKMLGAKR